MWWGPRMGHLGLTGNLQVNMKDCARLVSRVGWGGGALVYFKVSSTLKKINKCQSRVTIRLSTERYTIDPLLPALSLYLWDSVSNAIQR